MNPANAHWHKLPVFGDSLVVLDTNVLLHLYGLDSKGRDEVLELLDAVAEDLVIPHQAVLEFYRNLEQKERAVDQAYVSAIKAARTLVNDVVGPFDRAGSKDHSARAAALAAAKKASEELVQDLEGQAADQETVEANTALLTRIDALIKHRALAPLKPKRRLRAFREFVEFRAPRKVPPGFEDAPKPGTRAAGDYLLWVEVLRHARSSARDLILVTEDSKADWWTDGRPHEDLVLEFEGTTGQRYGQVRLSEFLTEGKEAYSTDVSAETVDAVRHSEENSAADEALRVYEESRLRERQLRGLETSALDYLASLPKTQVDPDMFRAFRPAHADADWIESMQNSLDDPTLRAAIRAATLSPDWRRSIDAMADPNIFAAMRLGSSQPGWLKSMQTALDDPTLRAAIQRAPSKSRGLKTNIQVPDTAGSNGRGLEASADPGDS